MNVSSSSISCGIRQLYGLDGNPLVWKSALKAVAPKLSRCSCPVCTEHRRKHPSAEWRGCAFVIFSDTTSSAFGEGFAKWLKDNKMGDITEVCSGRNPNTGNTIKMWSWALPASKAEFDAALEAAKVK